MVVAGECAGFHTAPLGGAPFAGGQRLGSPFGTIMSTNITPDMRYGIGRYTFGDFERALRQGIAPVCQRLYPTMPYASFTKVSDDDLHELYAYMMHGVAPVSRPAPPSDVSFPFNQRWALRFWQWIFVSSGAYAEKAGHDARWNRGAYFVQGLGIALPATRRVAQRTGSAATMKARPTISWVA